MRHVARIPFLRAGAILAAALVILPGIALARSHPSIGTHRLAANTAGPVIVFGGQPVIPMHPFKISIYADGRVTGEGPTPPLKTHVALDLAAIVKLAEAEGYFSMPATIAGKRPNVDNGPRFVTIDTSTGARTVTLLPNAESNDFLQLYGTLMDLVNSVS